MNRRKFIHSSLLLGASFAARNLPVSLPTSDQALNRNLLIPRYESQSPQVLQATIISFFVALVSSVISEVISPFIIDWIQDLTSSNQGREARTAQETYDDMKAYGFTDDTHAEVNILNNNTYIYPMIFPDGFNACAGFIKRTPFSRIDYVEGPTVAGIGQAASDLYSYLNQDLGMESEAAKEQTGNLVIPRRPLRLTTTDPNNPHREQRFNTNYSVSYETRDGVMEIDYGQTNERNVGVLGLRIIPDVELVSLRSTETIEFAPLSIEYPDSSIPRQNA